jgi:hypothetical protein
LESLDIEGFGRYGKGNRAHVYTILHLRLQSRFYRFKRKDIAMERLHKKYAITLKYYLHQEDTGIIPVGKADYTEIAAALPTNIWCAFFVIADVDIRCCAAKYGCPAYAMIQHQAKLILDKSGCRNGF